MAIQWPTSEAEESYIRSPKNVKYRKVEEVEELDQNDQEMVVSAGTAPADQPASASGNAGQARPAMSSTAPQPAPGPKKSRTVLMVAVAAIVVVVVVVAALLLLGNGGTSNGAFNGTTNNGSLAAQIHDGSYLEYSGTITIPTGGTMTGTISITFSNTTSTSYTMTESITIYGHTTTVSQKVNRTTESWINSSSGTTGTVGQQTLVGTETLQTNFGTKTTNHYTTSYSGYTYDYWEDTSSQMLYKMQFTYGTGGTFSCTLTSTNMM